ncbi:MAG TPA: DHA2 family efflux MFS transporter permease subunit [Gammaproteobacteria bacterium]|jgi:DHA2 family multidrug resistance protein
MAEQAVAAAAAPRKSWKDSPWAIAPVVALAAFMEVLDISIANVALQHIAGSMSASQDESTWVLTSYLVTNAIVLPISGWLSEVFGRKRFFTACIIGFTATSLLCGIAPSLMMLVVFRAMQGFAGGGLQPVSQAILADSFPPEKRGMAFAMYGLAVVFAPAIGPTLGGWITDQASWRWVFLINVPVGLLLVTLVTAMVHDAPDAEAKRKERVKKGVHVDYIGFGLLALGLGGLQVVMDKGERDDWFGSNFILLLCIVVGVSLVAFVVRELRAKEPIVDLRLLKNRNFAVSNVLMFILGFVLLGSTQLIPQFVQTSLGYSATDAGLVLSPGGLALVFFMPIMGKLATHVDARWLIMFGLALSGASLLYMTNFDLQVDYMTIAVARLFQALGLAFLFIPINTVAYVGMPKEKTNMATALINLSRNLGGSVGISLVQTVFARRAQFHQTVLTEKFTSFSASGNSLLTNLTSHFQSLPGQAVDAAKQAQVALYRLVQQQAVMLSFIDVFKLMALSFLVAIPIVLLMNKRSAAPSADVVAH